MSNPLPWSASLVLVALSLAACGGEAASSSPAAAPTSTPTTDSASTGSSQGPAKIVAFVKAPESGQIDKVGTVDGNFSPDQTPDLVFDLTVQGSVKAVFVITVGRDGTPNKRYRADTLVKEQEAPEELGGMLEQGAFSGGIGVYENGKIINDGDGSLPPTGAGTHTLRLYVNRVETLGTAGHVRAYAIAADGQLLEGPVTAY